MERSMFNVCGFSLMWSSIYYFLCRVKPHRSYEWHCRTVTAVHATTVCLLSLWCAFVQGPWPFTDMVGPSTPLQNVTIMVCLGYFLFDLTWCFYFQTEGPVMLMHHLISVAGMTVAVVTGKYGTEMIATIFGSEVTNPFLQTRWFLRETGNYNTRLGTFVDITFMSMFGFFRIGIGSYLLYTYFRQDTENIGRFAALVIYGISWLFWISIMQYAFKKIRRAFSKSSSKSSETNSTKVVLNGNHNCSSNGVSINHSAGHKLLANGSLDIKACQDISNEIHRNGYHKISNGDISEVDKGSLRQRIPNGIIEEKVLHSTMVSSQVK